ncbi:MAG: hypothetical protein BZ138_06465 [Methanosphaera sp. rholeuAM270]|nr:MAG: hypothetical protein BZ138_06465 [Methanosphaera sp. rholeuAM270]
MKNTETTLNRCDRCHKLYEDVEVFDGMRLCPECLDDMQGEIDEPSGLDDLADISMYGEEYRDAMLKEIDAIKAQIDLDVREFSR